ncbi:MAG TPA: M20/M25/M40 family metallo-hydrolase [Vicinamibacterales bacterium]
MKTSITLFVTLVLAVPAYAQKASNISEASVRSHMEFLASDALNGRGSGTRDEWIAAAYIASQLRRWGIEPLGDNGGYVQDVQIERTEVAAPPTLTFAGGTLTHGKEMFVQGLGAAKVSGPLQKLPASGVATAGAVVLLAEGAPPAPQTAGALPALIISIETDQQRTRRQAGTTRPLTLPARIVGTPAPAARPTMIAVDKDSYAALSKLADGTAISLQAELKPVTIAHTWNAIGKLKGTAKNADDQVILLTAHLDHLGNRGAGASTAIPSPPAEDTIYNGADDDASGSVAVLELAEQLAKGKRPKRTVIFAWFGSEESGGFGARHFIDAPPVPLEKIVANLEFEMIGRSDKAVPPHTLWLTGYERSNLGPELAKRGAKIVADPHPEQNFFQRSDNIQLARRGVIAQTVSSFGLHTDYHRPTDEVKTIDFAHMTDSIRSMLKPVQWLANSNFVPAWLPGKKP